MAWLTVSQVQTQEFWRDTFASDGPQSSYCACCPRSLAALVKVCFSSPGDMEVCMALHFRARHTGTNRVTPQPAHEVRLRFGIPSQDRSRQSSSRRPPFTFPFAGFRRQKADVTDLSGASQCGRQDYAFYKHLLWAPFDMNELNSEVGHHFLGKWSISTWLNSEF